MKSIQYSTQYNHEFDNPTIADLDLNYLDLIDDRFSATTQTIDARTGVILDSVYQKIT